MNPNSNEYDYDNVCYLLQEQKAFEGSGDEVLVTYTIGSYASLTVETNDPDYDRVYTDLSIGFPVTLIVQNPW